MRCPYCTHPETKVIDSRLANEAAQVRRRRQCLSCGERFTTYESPEVNMPRVVKRDGRREPFDEAKLHRSFICALEKRPISTEAIDEAMMRIRHRLMARGEREVSTGQMGDWVMEELKALDQVGYIRFASVYLSFDDVSAFQETIERLEKEPTPEMQAQQIPLLDLEKETGKDVAKDAAKDDPKAKGAARRAKR